MKFVVPCSFVLSCLLSACASAPESIVNGPTTVRTTYPVTNVERNTQGSLFDTNSPMLALYQDNYAPRHVGDTLKIDISESTSGSNKSSMATSRSNSVATKGPGTGTESMGSLLRGLLNMDVTASGSDSFTGSGKTENANSLKGKLAASVINILPNGHLVVAGEKSVAFNGTVSTLRFSGVVNPRDVKNGYVVSSEDVVDARLEQVGKGQIHDSNAMGWLQKLLTDSLNVW